MSSNSDHEADNFPVTDILQAKPEPWDDADAAYSTLEDCGPMKALDTKTRLPCAKLLFAISHYLGSLTPQEQEEHDAAIEEAVFMVNVTFGLSGGDAFTSEKVAEVLAWMAARPAWRSCGGKKS